jgi:phosphoglycolate phosphatase
MEFDAYLFDLDGTLLDTLPDLHATVNHALELGGFPPRTIEEVLGFVGNGALALVWSCVPEGTPQDIVDLTYQRFCDSYDEYGTSRTKEYPGMTDVIRDLKSKGKKLGVVSNKFHAGVVEVIDQHFPGLFDCALGESPETPRKPDPTGLLKCAAALDVAPERCLFVGDSASDMRAAHNAGMKALGCTWGYPPLDKLMEGEPDLLVNAPKEILSL